jgi:hypothetical protein
MVQKLMKKGDESSAIMHYDEILNQSPPKCHLCGYFGFKRFKDLLAHIVSHQ